MLTPLKSTSIFSNLQFLYSNLFFLKSFEIASRTYPCRAMNADQEHSVDPSHATMSSSRGLFLSSPTSQPAKSEDMFRFLDLPLELRLKIYTYLLPPRIHKIVTQNQNTGYFFNTSNVPQASAISYPFGRTPASTTGPHHPSPTYKVLTQNFRVAYPEPSINPEIFRVSKQIKSEAEPILYGAKDTIFDFGTSIEVIERFFGERSAAARGVVRNVRIAREIPAMENRDGFLAKSVDEKWMRVCNYLRTELPGLRMLDLTMWSSSGSVASFPVSIEEVGLVSTRDGRNASVVELGDHWELQKKQQEVEREWKKWEWTKHLLAMENLRRAKITWWGFCNVPGHDGEKQGFDSWLAGRMVADRLVRDRMCREGIVVEGSVLLSCGRA
jgi:hypothetical protein